MSSGAQQHNPGPGSYDRPSSLGRQTLSVNRSSTGPKMAFRTIFPGDKPSKLNPDGPGRCRCDGALGKQPSSSKRTAPSFTMLGRSGQPPNLDPRQPGPGQYEVAGDPSKYEAVSNRTSAPKFSFGRRDRERQSDKAPGPGTYEPGSGLGKQPVSLRASLPSYSFGAPAGPRRKKASTRGVATAHGDVPGPGNYEVPSSFGGRSVFNRHGGASMSGRVPIGGSGSTTGTPGPGAYDEEPAKVRGRTDRLGKFSKTSRDGSRGKGTTLAPGPGHYDSHTVAAKPGGPAYTMRPRTFYEARPATDIGECIGR